ncbi:DnaJ-domain-containing protein [Mycena vitilis]|nr:DnaJ-domain-containing protein [Mycena vitilis]
MAIALLGVIGWAFIPHHATKQALKLLHHFSRSFLRLAAPPPGTLEYQRHYRYTFAVVVLGYLIYTLIDTANSMLPNYYEILGVPPTADDTALKLAFRQFAKKFHPDRVGPQGEALFIRVRDAFEALKNPTVRFAYDRFGPDVLNWTHCSTVGEYLRHGLTQSIGYHVVTGAVLVFWTAIGETSPVAFWRYLLYVALFASELALLLSPSPTLTPSSLLLPSATFAPGAGPSHLTPLHALFPRRVAYQHILFLHQLFLFLSIALSRVAPQFFPDAGKVTDALAGRVLQLVCAADREASLMLHAELHSLSNNSTTDAHGHAHAHKPFRNTPAQPTPDVMDALSGEMEKMLIEGAVRNAAAAGPLRSAYDAAVQRGAAALALMSSSVAESHASSAPQTPQKERDRWGTWSGYSSAKGSPLKFGGSPGGNSVPWVHVNGNAQVNEGRGSPGPAGEGRPSYVRGRSMSFPGLP